MISRMPRPFFHIQAPLIVQVLGSGRERPNTPLQGVSLLAPQASASSLQTLNLHNIIGSRKFNRKPLPIGSIVAPCYVVVYIHLCLGSYKVITLNPKPLNP